MTRDWVHVAPEIRSKHVKEFPTPRRAIMLTPPSVIMMTQPRRCVPSSGLMLFSYNLFLRSDAHYNLTRGTAPTWVSPVMGKSSIEERCHPLPKPAHITRLYELSGYWDKCSASTRLTFKCSPTARVFLPSSSRSLRDFRPSSPSTTS